MIESFRILTSKESSAIKRLRCTSSANVSSSVAVTWSPLPKCGRDYKPATSAGASQKYLTARGLLCQYGCVMAMNNNGSHGLLKIHRQLEFLRDKGLDSGMAMCDIRRIVFRPKKRHKEDDTNKKRWTVAAHLPSACLGIFLLITASIVDKKELTSRCAVGNNYLIMEMTRPVTDCTICENVSDVLELDNVTRIDFERFAYSGRPVLVRGATRTWSALQTFNFEFFQKLYNETPGAYQSVEEECQFFPFRTDFLSLADVFNMSRTRANLSGPEAVTWYIGWSNCNPEIASVLRRHYSRPSFLPVGSEASAIDWIFMGYSGQGASMHLDYVQRPSWQAQISGAKTWHLAPPPECENVCQAFSVHVHKGDIILVDTNQWYHDTFIHKGEISITIGSEYD